MLTSTLLLLVLPARADGPDPAELQAFREAATRFEERMKEFVGDVRKIVDEAEAEDRAKVHAAFGGAIQRSDDAESGLRRTAIAKLEAFLKKYPRTPYTADMEFRLADLYFEESEVDFLTRMDEYNRLEQQAMANPNLVLPEPPVKDYARSIALYKDILQNHPGYEFTVNTWYMYGWCLGSSTARQYDEDGARDAYQVIVEKFPKTEAANDANMRLGEYWFDHADNRENTAKNIPLAIKYYEAVLADGPSGRNYDEAIYKLGWSHFKLNQFDQALAYLVQLLDYSDKQFRDSGRNSAMRPEAVEYLAISYADMASRNGGAALDVARRHIAKIGDRKWQHDVMSRLAAILDQQARFEESIGAYLYLQEKWPLDADNPKYQNEVARIWLKMPPAGDPQKAAEAYAELSRKYAEGTPWWMANKNNPDAIAVARGFIEQNLGDLAKQYFLHANETKAPADYLVAAQKLNEFLDTFPNSEEYYELQKAEAFAYYSAKEYAEAERLYSKMLSDPGAPHRDHARFQLMKVREEVAIARFGKLEIRPPDAMVERELNTPYGKKVVVYKISDEQKAFVSSADDITKAEIRDPEIAKAVKDARAALTYIPGQIYQAHGHNEEARKRLLKVVDTWPERKEGLFAANLVVQTYVDEGDLENVLKWTRKFKQMSLGGGQPTDFEGTEEAAAFNIAYRYIEKGERLRAADAYVEFMKEFPQSKYYKDALYNAANNYERSGKAERSIQLFEEYIAKYPADERSKDLYLRLGENYSSILELEKAIKYFDALPRLDVNHVDAPVALSNAAFLRIGVGDHKGAASSLEEYARLFPNQPDAEKLFWKAGEQWELVGEKESQDFYARYLAKFPGADPNHRIEALYRIASYKEKKGQVAATTWTQLQEVYRANLGGNLSQRSRSLAAEGALKDLQKAYDAFKVYKFANNEKKDTELVLKTKPEQLKAVNEQALKLIQDYQDFDTSTASLYVQGIAHFAYADMLYAVPLPKGLSEDEQQIYRDELDRVRLPIEDRGKARLAAALEKARTEKRWNDWVAKALAALHDRYPSEFPSERQETKGGIGAESIPFAGPASLPTEEAR